MMFDGLTQQMPTPKDEGFWARFNHPLFGAFAGSWLLCNWEIVYLLIRGLPTTADTVKEITEKYLIADRLSHLVGYPFAAAVGFFFLGPVIEDLHDLYKNRMAARIGRHQTVSKWQYEQEARLRQQAEEQREIYKRVAGANEKMVPNGQGGTMALDQLMTNYQSLMKQLQEVQNERDQLKADLLTVKSQAKSK